MILDSALPSNECRNSSLWEWLQDFNPFRSVPEGGWVTNILEQVLLIECTKRKLVEFVGEQAVLVQALYSLTYSMVAFVIAQASAATTCFVQEITRSRQLENTFRAEKSDTSET